MLRATTSLPEQLFVFFIFHSAFLLTDHKNLQQDHYNSIAKCTDDGRRRYRNVCKNVVYIAFFHCVRLLTRHLFTGPCHCSYIFVLCLTFRVRVAGDLNQKCRSLQAFSRLRSLALYSGSSARDRAALCK